MTFKFEVGTDEEKETVSFSRDPWLGRMIIETDTRTLLRTEMAGFSFDPVQEYKFELGSTNQHKVKITHTRPQWFGGFFPHTYVVFVDGKEICAHKGY